MRSSVSSSALWSRSMQRRPDVYLDLALIALRRVPRFLQRAVSMEEYLADDYCQSAVERQLEIAGDALGQLRKIAPDLFKRIPRWRTSSLPSASAGACLCSARPQQVYEIASLRAGELLQTLERLLAELPEQTVSPTRRVASRSITLGCAEARQSRRRYSSCPGIACTPAIQPQRTEPNSCRCRNRALLTSVRTSGQLEALFASL